jgi:hypothetical protein
VTIKETSDDEEDRHRGRRDGKRRKESQLEIYDIS